MLKKGWQNDNKRLEMRKSGLDQTTFDANIEHMMLIKMDSFLFVS